jgi:hypothetical protein
MGKRRYRIRGDIYVRTGVSAELWFLKKNMAGGREAQFLIDTRHPHGGPG